MKFTALSFLGLLALVQSENPSLRAGLEFKNDEREAGALCNAAVRNVKDKLEENLPFTFDCSCTFRLFRPIDYSCSSKVCIQDIKEILDVSQTLPLTDATCMNPSASGTLAKRTGALTTKVCSGSSAIVLDILQIEAKLQQEIYDQDTYEVVVPSSCLQVSHNVNDLNNFTSCSATIGNKSCGCTPCENGSGVMLDCSALIDEILPEFLDDALSYTEVCLHPGIYDDLGRQSSDPLALGLFGLILSMDA
ncbi:hypothetical protein FisN_4Lh212 [Fistulifera solaris]|uniref:Uncharacterized protein n=1 Tax=Fistulifera solaris TaxID=1519565 RepID=A0A1Z5JYT5_FISSO|nr:hypothetical protein FisN_4Lh212 [Fistulifera solaris]|eukprot:GAX19203.1 hypothetical protein FisN_4Lh212 [Fistulifera solaris]